jgi:hypothetical protein
METQHLIELVLAQKNLTQLIDWANPDHSFRQKLKELHPDVCKLPQAEEAFMKLSSFRDFFEKGEQLADDAGFFHTNFFWAKWESDSENLLQVSHENFLWLMLKSEEADKHFQRYFPASFEKSDKENYHIDFQERAIPLSKVKDLYGGNLPHEHVNWITNRLLEIASYFAGIGVVHAGLTPDSVFITPENHGLQVASFYHMQFLNERMNTCSGRYINWYPTYLFLDNTATSRIDLEMIKKIAVFLLGEESGNASKLRNTHHPAIIDFLLYSHDEPIEALDDHKSILKLHFEKKFHILNI